MSTSTTSVADCVPSVGLDYGYCGVSQTATKSFTLVNLHSHIVRFEVQTDNCPFVITPMQGNSNIIGIDFYFVL